jgi:hypothetical protein
MGENSRSAYSRDPVRPLSLEEVIFEYSYEISYG